jgi:hypothetical protein
MWAIVRLPHEETMDLESEMSRQPIAWMWNHIVPGATWLSMPNHGDGTYIPGLPDGLAYPWGLPVECKADRGSLYTGNPDYPATKSRDWKQGDKLPQTTGLHTSQRNWLEGVCRKPGNYIPFYMAAWMNPLKDGRLDHRLDRYFLVNVDVWLDMEHTAVTKYSTRSVPLNSDTTNYKYRTELNVEKWFGQFALIQYLRVTEKGKRVAWRIPVDHPLWDDLRRHQSTLLSNLELVRRGYDVN